MSILDCAKASSVESLDKQEVEVSVDISGYRWVEVTNTYFIGAEAKTSTMLYFLDNDGELVASIAELTNLSPIFYNHRNRSFLSLDTAKRAVEDDVRKGYRTSKDYGPF